MLRPNGCIASRDGRTLYVGDSERKHWRAYELSAAGEVGAGRLFFDPETENRDSPDGMTIDEHGDLYFAGRGGVWVVTPEGTPLGLIPVPEFCSNVTFGGADGKTLYLTCSKKVYQLAMQVRGAQLAADSSPQKWRHATPKSCLPPRRRYALTGWVGRVFATPHASITCTMKRPVFLSLGTLLAGPLPLGLQRVVLLAALLAARSVTADDAPPVYQNHRDLMVWRDAAGEHPVKTPADWAKRRAHILLGMQQAMGKLPDRSHLPPLDVQVERDRTTARRSRGSSSRSRPNRATACPATCSCPRDSTAAACRASSRCTRRPRWARESRPAWAPAKTSTTDWNWPSAAMWCWCPTIPASATTSTTSTPTRYTSGSMKGIFNHMRAVDLLVSRPEVDPRADRRDRPFAGRAQRDVRRACSTSGIKVIVSSCGWTPLP